MLEKGVINGFGIFVYFLVYIFNEYFLSIYYVLKNMLYVCDIKWKILFLILGRLKWEKKVIIVSWIII